MFHRDLSLVLFSIYVNVLIKSTNKLSFSLFANDTNLFCAGNVIKKREGMFDEDLSHVQKRLSLNQLTLIIKKIPFYGIQITQETVKNKFVY